MTPLEALKELLNACSNYADGSGDEARWNAARKKAYEFYKKETRK